MRPRSDPGRPAGCVAGAGRPWPPAIRRVAEVEQATLRKRPPATEGTAEAAATSPARDGSESDCTVRYNISRQQACFFSAFFCESGGLAPFA